jgi:hypothetical protein
MGKITNRYTVVANKIGNIHSGDAVYEVMRWKMK